MRRRSYVHEAYKYIIDNNNNNNNNIIIIIIIIIIIMNEWMMNKQANERTYERTNEWMNETCISVYIQWPGRGLPNLFSK